MATGLLPAAAKLQKKGRGGDTLLAHINTDEAAMLRRAGGSGTRNPKTGLLEFYEDGGSDWQAETYDNSPSSYDGGYESSAPESPEEGSSNEDSGYGDLVEAAQAPWMEPAAPGPDVPSSIDFARAEGVQPSPRTDVDVNFENGSDDRTKAAPEPQAAPVPPTPASPTPAAQTGSYRTDKSGRQWYVPPSYESAPPAPEPPPAPGTDMNQFQGFTPGTPLPSLGGGQTSAYNDAFQAKYPEYEASSSGSTEGGGLSADKLGVEQTDGQPEVSGFLNSLPENVITAAKRALGVDRPVAALLDVLSTLNVLTGGYNFITGVLRFVSNGAINLPSTGDAIAAAGRWVGEQLSSAGRPTSTAPAGPPGPDVPSSIDFANPGGGTGLLASAPDVDYDGPALSQVRDQEQSGGNAAPAAPNAQVATPAYGGGDPVAVPPPSPSAASRGNGLLTGSSVPTNSNAANRLRPADRFSPDYYGKGSYRFDPAAGRVVFTPG
ncbi:MAG: hypothetical protein Q7S17_07805 [Xanthobacteraceae bacterium]|nr:hypothetical protein [Xanthobacteraceae bacterium]